MQLRLFVRSLDADGITLIETRYPAQVYGRAIVCIRAWVRECLSINAKFDLFNRLSVG